MNSPTPSDRAADEQASLWAARLEGADLNASDRAALDAWLQADPANRAQLASYCQFSADLEMALPALMEAGAIARPQSWRSAPVRSRGRFAKVALATAAMAAALALGFWTLRPAAPIESFAAPPGQRQAFTLADGTRVELNAQTTLQFANHGGERHARLLEGEAFFAVSKDHGRPFTVETPSGAIRVTGTSFDVRAIAGALEVTVVEGSVQVLPTAVTGVREPTSLALGAGDRLLVGAGGVTMRKLGGDALDDLLAWRRGLVVFVGEPLESALARFARYHARPILVTPAAAAQQVSGRHSLDDLDGFLAGIEDPLGIRTTKEAGGALRVSLRSE